MLRTFGISASPLTVWGVIGNAKFAQVVRDPDAPTDDLEAFDRFCREREAWGFRVGGGVAKGANDWPHHLTAVVEGRQLLDVSIDQASRPWDGIVLSPLLLPCDEEFLTGSKPLVHITTEGGCYIRYEAKPGETSYEVAEDWNPDLAHNLKRTVMDQMRDDLAG